MFERFLDNAHRVVLMARTEAHEFGSDQVEAEHLLLGIVREDKDLLAHLQLPPEVAIRSRMRSSGLPKAEAAYRELPMSLAAEQALDRGAQEAARLGHQQVAPIHLLMGLLQDEQSVAYELLKSHGITLAQVEELSRKQLPMPPESTS